MSTAVSIDHGQIWRDPDTRQQRYVRIDTLPSPWRQDVGIRTVVKNDFGKWVPAHNARLNYANKTRFNGKRSGYVFFEHPTSLSSDASEAAS